MIPAASGLRETFGKPLFHTFRITIQPVGVPSPAVEIVPWLNQLSAEMKTILAPHQLGFLTWQSDKFHQIPAFGGNCDLCPGASVSNMRRHWERHHAPRRALWFCPIEACSAVVADRWCLQDHLSRTHKVSTAMRAKLLVTPSCWPVNRGTHNLLMPPATPLNPIVYLYSQHGIRIDNMEFTMDFGHPYGSIIRAIITDAHVPDDFDYESLSNMPSILSQSTIADSRGLSESPASSIGYGDSPSVSAVWEGPALMPSSEHDMLEEHLDMTNVNRPAASSVKSATTSVPSLLTSCPSFQSASDISSSLQTMDLNSIVARQTSPSPVPSLVSSIDRMSISSPTLLADQLSAPVPAGELSSALAIISQGLAHSSIAMGGSQATATHHYHQPSIRIVHYDLLSDQIAQIEAYAHHIYGVAQRMRGSLQAMSATEGGKVHPPI